jgi:hypothetical protein
VDTIDEVRELRFEQMTGAAQGRFVKGVTSGTLMLLDTERMLADVICKEESENVC